MTVDTAAQSSLSHWAEHLESLSDNGNSAVRLSTGSTTSLIKRLRSAADELDELRSEADQMNAACVAHAKENAELRSAHALTKRDVAKMSEDLKIYNARDRDWIEALKRARAEHEVTTLSLQQMDQIHAEMKRELEEMRALRRVDEALRDATRARLESAEEALTMVTHGGCAGVSEGGCTWCLSMDLDKGWTTAELVSGNKHHESCPVGAHFARYGGGNG